MSNHPKLISMHFIVDVIVDIDDDDCAFLLGFMPNADCRV